ncbi:GtrA family protein [Sporosalibacterium faouarense]|uniref:GtrA family protein n=1 Tax=Sporosalibacterium faouarense TaxID=516123 RepID=UPI00141C40A7|nr:GtrA family protein [Sporosalibacterium faouarense]MTI48652.1 GtrA family protein [Bacillota bacterium]
MSRKKSIREIGLYTIFGVFTTLINFIVYYLLIYLNIDFKIATSIAFIVSVIFAYFTNRNYVFSVRAKSIKEMSLEGLKFLSSRILTYFFDIFGLMLLIELINMDQVISKLVVNVLVVIINYVLSKFYIFKKEKRLN